MKKIIASVLAISATLFWQGCSSEESTSAEPESSSSAAIITIDSTLIEDEVTDDLPNYSRAIEMNKKIGQGVNFGNAWESSCNNITADNIDECDDSKWSSKIQDEWFQIVKDMGFQSIRIPVRWNQTAQDEPPYTLQALRVEGVKHHVQMANSLGMVAIINQHHYNELYANPDAQKEKFFGIWERIAEEFKDFPDDSLVFEVLNESRDKSDAILAELAEGAIKIIRKTNPNRTIMLNPGNWGKFELMDTFVGIKDSNLIITGHYYEPYKYTHQGHNDSCKVTWKPNDQTAIMNIVNDFKGFVAQAKSQFPGKNGTYIPLNMGEFGASSLCEDVADDANRASYLKAIIQVANQLGISWNIWAFSKSADFDIYDFKNNIWLPTIGEVLKNNIN